ncbi:MAG: hypothetical protein QOD77_2104 [Thermoplasmata archaeon]|jgi:hypothetical protein|nr:hypothetical protein [Thermoplasmata archaeon]
MAASPPSLRWLPALAVAILVVSGVAGALVQRSDITATPVSKAPPVTLAAGTSGTTTLGASATSAATTVSIVVGAVSPLKVHKVSGNWDVSLALVSATGFSALESVTVNLVGSSTQTQVVVVLGTATQTQGIPITLSGADLTVTATGTAGVTGVLNLQVRMVPNGQSIPLVTYTYTLTFA